VLAELAARPARAAWWPRLALGSAAVAGAVVILTMIVNHRADPPVDQTIASAPAEVSAPVPSNPAGTSLPAASKAGAAPSGRILLPESPVTSVARPAVPENRPIQAASVDSIEAIAIDPLTPVERLTPLEPIGVRLVVTADISLKPITIEAIQITPLTPPPSPQR
jgi:hypothetical protein